MLSSTTVIIIALELVPLIHQLLHLHISPTAVLRVTVVRDLRATGSRYMEAPPITKKTAENSSVGVYDVDLSRIKPVALWVVLVREYT